MLENDGARPFQLEFCDAMAQIAQKQQEKSSA